jgi:hypothetical protein
VKVMIKTKYRDLSAVKLNFTGPLKIKPGAKT